MIHAVIPFPTEFLIIFELKTKNEATIQNTARSRNISCEDGPKYPKADAKTNAQFMTNRTTGRPITTIWVNMRRSIEN